MGQQYNDVKARVAELAGKRDRTGEDPLSSDDRVQILNEIYDGLLYLWKQCVITGTAKGTSAIKFQLEGARLEIESLGGNQNHRTDTQSIGWEYDAEKEKELLALIPDA
jgi:hypothetical protein